MRLQRSKGILQGEFKKDAQGNRKRVDSDLKSTSKKVWDKAFGTNHSADDKGIGNSVPNSMDDASDISDGNKQGSSSGTENDVSKHGTPPDSNIHNDSTHSAHKQGVSKMKAAGAAAEVWDKVVNKGDSDGFKATSDSSNGTSRESVDISGSDKQSSGTKTENDVSKHRTPPDSNIHNDSTHSAHKQGVSKMKAAGAAGTAAFALDAFATGNLGQIGGSLKQFGSKIAYGNILGQGGALADVEALVVGKVGLDTARSQIDKGQVASGFATLAKGMAGQSINGIAEMGEMAIAGTRTAFNGRSYAQNRQDDFIPSVNFTAADQAQQYAAQRSYASTVSETGTHGHIQAAVGNNPVSPAMNHSPAQRAAQETIIAQVASNNAQSSVQLTALDIQQTHQTRQLAQSQADYTREVSRSMEEMVTSFAELG